MDKKELRKKVLGIRGAIEESDRKEKSALICRKILESPLYQNSSCVFTFIPFGNEVDIRPILEDGIRQGKKMAVPKTFTKEKYIAPYEFTGWDRLVSGVYGILEPDPSREMEINPQDIDLILVPGVAFDRMGGRLGYGGGFYDRFLSKYDKLPLLVAVCFHEQVMEEIPMKPHDFKVDMILTDDDSIDC